MRLHRLRMTAFGPFPGTVTVDFDTLGADGLFLVHGETGAGKSTVLDGVCFGLYGGVPGHRDDARTLRSHHAPPGRAPEVELDVTLANRRLRITRSPEWRRARKRGEGTTVEKAHVEVVERLPDGGETFRTRDHREAADLIRTEVGLERDQFCQVVLLPQGGFARFLQAPADERQALLRNLFDTEIFARAEQWLAQHRTRLGQEVRAAAGTIRDTVQRIAEANDTTAPSDVDSDEGLELLPDWARGQRARLAERAAALHPARDRAEADELRLGHVAREAALLAAAQRDHRDAVRDLAEVVERLPERDGWKRQLDLARKAAALTPYVDEWDRRDAAAQQASTRAAACLAAVPADVMPAEEAPAGVEDVDRDALAAAHAARTEMLHATRAAAESAAALDIARGERDTARMRLEELSARREKAAAELAQAPFERHKLVARRQEAQEIAGTAAAAALTLAQARQRAQHVARRDLLRTDLTAAQREQRSAHDRYVLAADERLRLRELRLAGIAAELAQRLRPGDPCTVCGSTDHPAPARPVPGSVSAEEEKRAEARATELLAARQGADVRVEMLTGQVAEAVESAGELTAEHAADAVGSAAQRVAAAADAARHVASIDEDLTTLDAMVADRTAERASVEREAAVTAGGIDAWDARIAELVAHIDRVRGTDPTLDARAQRLAAELAALRAAADAVDGWRHAVDELVAARREARERLDSSPFVDAAALRAAALPEHTTRALERRVEQFDDRRLKLAGRAEDPALRAAAAQPVPDVEAHEREHETARQSANELRSAADAVTARLERLRVLGSALDAAIAGWRPRRAEYEIANRLAQLVEGKSADSDVRMTLSTYVLTHRFRHVVAAANTRLDEATGNRYLLRHVTDADTGRRSGRGGLGLEVIDAWTGHNRRPSTLSGGETFLVSLCLALGLSDVVLAETGGAHLGSLFVDEGFGSLDEDALDQVMDVLDELRSGGRIVGLVSHVAELRRRIPTRLRVKKTATGSSVELICGHRVT